jgi:alpha-tubulin suppressor-like RCC1 family protein
VRIAAELGAHRDEYVIRVVLQRAAAGVAFSEGSTYYGSAASCAIAAETGALFCRRRPVVADTAPVFTEMGNHPGVPLRTAHVSQGTQCGLSPDGRIYCWGSSEDFLLGFRPPPGPVAGEPVRTDLRFSAFALGGHSTMCAIRADDSVLYCWGHNDRNQVGREPIRGTDTVIGPVTGELRARAVSVSNFRTCALDLDDAPWCWGGNGSGARGLGVSVTSGTVPTPRRVFGDHSFTSISVAEVHQCALTAAGEAYCWGQNDQGQLGNGTRLDPANVEPQRVAGDLRFSVFATLGFPNATCGLTTGNDLYCWGAFAPSAVSSRLGDRRAAPFHLLPGQKFRALSPVLNSMCAVTFDETILCW